MKVFARLLTALLFAAPLAAGAQDPACEVDQGNPQFVARSWLALSKAIAAVNQDADPSNDLRDALRTLTDPRARDRDKNAAGQQYTAGQAYILLLSSGTPAVVKRGDIGIQTDPEATIDLVLAADSAFTAVLAAHPECALTLTQWRQHKPWLALVNDAINALNTDQVDSAEMLANRSLVLDKTAPYAYTVLAMVARTRNQHDEALRLYREAIERAGTDTVFTDIRVKTLGDIARMLADRAQDAPADQRVALAREAMAAYDTYLAEQEIDDLSRGFGLSQLASMYALAGDSTRIRNIYAPILADPSKYGERTLLEAGVIATRADAMADAARLFGAVHATNPYQRDALNNLAAAYIGTEEYDKAFPLVQRLAEIDPNNPDVYMLYAYAYSGKLKGSQGAAQRALTDSLVKYNSLSEQMPVRVTISEFTRLQEETRVGGSIENKSRAPRSYTMQVELLDRSGQVIGTQEQNVGPVGAGERANFRVTFPVAGENIAGYRYKPLTT
jgi:tetratricopeptide (TPR) repeat protein